MVPRWGVGRDASLLIGGQAVRAAAYGFTAVILGALLAARGYGHLRAGLVLTALIAGTALASLVVGALADRVGRRRSYAVFFLRNDPSHRGGQEFESPQLHLWPSVDPGLCGSRCMSMII